MVVFGGPALWWDLPANAFDHLAGTDVWYRTYQVRSDMRGRYVISPNDPMTPLPREGTAEVAEREATFRADPFNPKTLVFPRVADDPVSVERRFSVLELPDAPAQPWAAARPDAPAGALVCERFTSELLGNTRRVWVHTPAGYERGDDCGPAGGAADGRADGAVGGAADGAACGGEERYGLAVLLDGRIWAEVLPIAPTLDNLARAGRIPPIVTVLVDTLDFATRERELVGNEDFPRMLVDELLPWVRARWRITDDPARALIQGQSYGGLAAALIALRATEAFGNASLHSPSLWWSCPGAPADQAEWMAHQHAVAPASSVRFYLEVGLQEGEWMVPTARHLRDVLLAKGNQMRYREYNGGHDANCWRGGIADALVWLTQDWGRVR
ncbi:MAG: alpha/beta hydrolase-fold protein [Actinomycetia bacterium]|nr:alpha/beta hydrolase-fold protein [Actinomycetes bacterium]